MPIDDEGCHPLFNECPYHNMLNALTPDELLGPLNEVEARRAPKTLYVAGDLELFRRQPRVSVVGSRKASPDGLKRAQKISRLLVEHGAIVVSGLAEGIDTAAHTAAIEAGGRTIGVIGTPLDKSYPRSNTRLQEEIAMRHALVSQFPVGYPTQPRNFPQRNATMALIVAASVIVEAGDTSGALSQGWEALRLGRLLFIMESVYHNPSLNWPREMVGYGAQVLSDENVKEFLSVLPTDVIGLDAITV
jgi:DNA processing protein